MEDHTPFKVLNALDTLGKQLAVARKRRRLSLREVAARAGLSVPTVMAAERGRKNVSIGAYACILWVYGLEPDLLNIAHPNLDKVGKALEQNQLPKRIRHKDIDDDF